MTANCHSDHTRNVSIRKRGRNTEAEREWEPVRSFGSAHLISRPIPGTSACHVLACGGTLFWPRTQPFLSPSFPVFVPLTFSSFESCQTSFHRNRMYHIQSNSPRLLEVCWSGTVQVEFSPHFSPAGLATADLWPKCDGAKQARTLW